MDLQCYIAMTAEEMRSVQKLPRHTAWMACHFSPYGTGLTNLPRNLPDGSMVIVNDRTPPAGHDMQRVADQLNTIACSCYLLDFQLPEIAETEKLTGFLTEMLEKPVAVSEAYQHCSNGPILISIPLGKSLTNHVKKFTDREIWLEAVTDSQLLSVTQSNCIREQAPQKIPKGQLFECEKLHCQYQMQLFSDRAEFFMNRGIPQIKSLLKEANQLQITKAVGLFQQLNFSMEENNEITDR